MQEINVVLTMDCEPTTATSHPAATGPATWSAGEDAVRGYVEIAEGYGLPVTLFVHPEAAVAQSTMFRELEHNGACLGLHMHPWKYSLWRHAGTQVHGPLRRAYRRRTGGAPCGSRPTFGPRPSAIGRSISVPAPSRPTTRSFRCSRPQGFRGGSCTAPGRLIPEMQAIWTGGQPDPHRASAVFRQALGALDFANMPLSADFSRPLAGPAGRNMFADFRPDVDWPGQYDVSYRTIATNIVSAGSRARPASAGPQRHHTQSLCLPQRRRSGLWPPAGDARRDAGRLPGSGLARRRERR